MEKRIRCRLIREKMERPNQNELKWTHWGEEEQRRKQKQRAWYYGRFSSASPAEMRFKVHHLRRLSESINNQSWVMCDFLWSSLRNHATRLSQRPAQQVAKWKLQEKQNRWLVRCSNQPPFHSAFVASPVLCGHDWATHASFQTQSQTDEVRTHPSRVQLSQGGASGKEPTCQCRKGVKSLGQEDPLEEGMAIHSSILAWKIPWTEEPGGFQSIQPKRVGQDWSNLAHMNLGGLPWRLSGKESACQTGDMGSIPGSRGSPGEGNGNPR